MTRSARVLPGWPTGSAGSSSAGTSQGLGIARSLGRHGIPVCVIDDETSISRASRFVQDVVRVRDLRSEQALLDALALARGKLGLSGWVLYPDPGRERRGASRRTGTRSRRTSGCPRPELASIRHAWDKRETYRLAERLSIPIPRTWFPRSEEDLAAIDVERPGRGEARDQGALLLRHPRQGLARGHRGGAARRLPPGRARSCRRARSSSRRLIPGGGQEQYAYCAFFRDGRPVASMTVRRRRQHPSDFGRASTYVETISAAGARRAVQPVPAGIGYYGLVELEYKRDPRDGACKLLDVNARTWGYHTLGQAAGVDFPYLLFRDQMGAPVEEAHARPGVRWIRLTTDVPNAVRDIRAGPLRARDYLRTLPRRRHRGGVLAPRPPAGPLRDRIAALPRRQARTMTSAATRGGADV